jgi:hypothetical protein
MIFFTKPKRSWNCLNSMRRTELKVWQRMAHQRKFFMAFTKSLLKAITHSVQNRTRWSVRIWKQLPTPHPRVSTATPTHRTPYCHHLWPIDEFLHQICLPVDLSSWGVSMASLGGNTPIMTSQWGINRWINSSCRSGIRTHSYCELFMGRFFYCYAWK